MKEIIVTDSDSKSANFLDNLFYHGHHSIKITVEDNNSTIINQIFERMLTVQRDELVVLDLKGYENIPRFPSNLSSINKGPIGFEFDSHENKVQSELEDDEDERPTISTKYNAKRKDAEAKVKQKRLDEQKRIFSTVFKDIKIEYSKPPNIKGVGDYENHINEILPNIDFSDVIIEMRRYLKEGNHTLKETYDAFFEQLEAAFLNSFNIRNKTKQEKLFEMKQREIFAYVYEKATYMNKIGGENLTKDQITEADRSMKDHVDKIFKKWEDNRISFYMDPLTKKVSGETFESMDDDQKIKLHLLIIEMVEDGTILEPSVAIPTRNKYITDYNEQDLIVQFCDVIISYEFNLQYFSYEQIGTKFTLKGFKKLCEDWSNLNINNLDTIRIHANMKNYVLNGINLLMHNVNSIDCLSLKETSSFANEHIVSTLFSNNIVGGIQMKTLSLQLCIDDITKLAPLRKQLSKGIIQINHLVLEPRQHMDGWVFMKRLLHGGHNYSHNIPSIELINLHQNLSQYDSIIYEQKAETTKRFSPLTIQSSLTSLTFKSSSLTVLMWGLLFQGLKNQGNLESISLQHSSILRASRGEKEYKQVKFKSYFVNKILSSFDSIQTVDLSYNSLTNKDVRKLILSPKIKHKIVLKGLINKPGVFLFEEENIDDVQDFTLLTHRNFQHKPMKMVSMKNQLLLDQLKVRSAPVNEAVSDDEDENYQPNEEEEEEVEEVVDEDTIEYRLREDHTDDPDLFPTIRIEEPNATYNIDALDISENGLTALPLAQFLNSFYTVRKGCSMFNFGANSLNSQDILAVIGLFDNTKGIVNFEQPYKDQRLHDNDIEYNKILNEYVLNNVPALNLNVIPKLTLLKIPGKYYSSNTIEERLRKFLDITKLLKFRWDLDMTFDSFKFESIRVLPSKRRDDLPSMEILSSTEKKEEKVYHPSNTKRIKKRRT